MSKSDISKYISQLSPMEQKVLHIAVSHLETSFSLSKSIGFQDWLRAKNKTLQSPPPQPQPPSKEEQSQSQPEPPKKASKIKIKKKLPSV